MTNMVQVALAEDVTEAEELQAILEQAGIPSELETAVEHHPRRDRGRTAEGARPGELARGCAERDRGVDRARRAHRGHLAAMKRLALLLAVLVIGVAPARAATNTYSTGNINLPIGASFAKSLTVPQRGPVSFVRVSFRISTPDTSSLAISLVSPNGTEVPLVTNRGAGADFGDGKGCTRDRHGARRGHADEPDRLRPGAVHRQPVPPGGESGVALR